MSYIGLFDAEIIPQGEPREKLGLLPAGKYLVKIEGSDVGKTKNGKGTRAQFTLVVVAGEHTGRKLWYNINIKHETSKTEEIGKRELAQLCRAVGKLKIRDTSELHDAMFTATVAIEPAKDGYDAKSVVKSTAPCSTADRVAALAPAITATREPWEDPATDGTPAEDWT